MKITSLEEMEKAARELLFCVNKTANSSGGAVVLLLSGELGSGKTTFVQALARELAIAERVTSPTFVIQKDYTVKKGDMIPAETSLGFKRLIHIDAYRLTTFSELEMLGWGEFIHDPETVVAVEWPEQVGLTASGGRTFSLAFSHVTENVRRLLFNGKETIC